MSKSFCRSVIIGVGLMIFGACVATPPPSTVSPPTPQAPAISALQTGLPAQSLAPNECGLFLWSKTDISKFVFFKRAGEDVALFWMDESVTKLQEISFAGRIFGQFYTEYDFQSEAGQNVSVSYIPGVDLQDGARIASGSIQYMDPKGWRTILPVLGARVCQPVVQGPQSVTTDGFQER